MFVAIFLGVSLHAQSNDTLRVLFIGNSHTYFNNMPVLFDSLSQSAGRNVITDMVAPGGFTLEEHSTYTLTLAMIEQGTWHYVVLQEQSQIPTINNLRFNSMYPAARRLDSVITQHNESTAFFMTWGWKYGGQMIIGGDSSPYFVNYFHMQESVRVAYESIATELSAKLCPVGMAWKRARMIDTLVDLWAEDNYHPTLKGSYLAACVFYSVFFNSSPLGLSYTAGLSPEDALFFQYVAWQTVSGITDNPRHFPHSLSEFQIYPNPFKDYTVIRSPSSNIRIYNINGRLVKSFSRPNTKFPITNNHFVWDGTNEYNEKVSAGLYFIIAKTDNKYITAPLIYVGK
jgi:hypothetical protein